MREKRDIINLVVRVMGQRDALRVESANGNNAARKVVALYQQWYEDPENGSIMGQLDRALDDFLTSNRQTVLVR